MKLNIGQNIRTLRRAADMTQDELAVKLGVAFQTVSRWENGGTYPDMELLPAISGVFGVTVDHLLGSNQEELGKQLKDLVKRIRDAVRNRENDTVIALLREVRRDMRQYTHYPHEFWKIWTALHWYGREAPPEVLEEVRLFFAEYRVFFTMIDEQHRAIEVMTIIEDEEHLEEFLNANSTTFQDFTAEKMLLERYKHRGEDEKVETAAEAYRHRTLDNLFYDHDDIMIEQNIAYLHALHGITPDPEHPISGDGSIDLWFPSRKWMGHIQAGACLDRGDKDGAFVILEDIVSMLEKLMAAALEQQKNNSFLELTDTSPLLPTFKKAVFVITNEYNGKKYTELKLTYKILRSYSEPVSPRFELEFCDNIYKHRIGDDPRYLRLRERMEALIRTPK